MRKLILKLLFITVVLIALIAAPSLIGNKGYVLISMGNLMIETSVVALGIMLLGAVVIWVLIRMLFGRAWQLTRLPGSWFGGRAERKKQRAFYRSIQALAEGEWDAATQAADIAEQGEFEGVNYLVAAQAAVARGKHDTATRKLNEAAEYPSSALAARVTLARMALSAHQPKQALAELDKLDVKQRPLNPPLHCACKHWQRVISGPHSKANLMAIKKYWAISTPYGPGRLPKAGCLKLPASRAQFS